MHFLKAFDSIWHEGLFYKMLESGVEGKSYDLIYFIHRKQITRHLCVEKKLEWSAVPDPTLHVLESKLLLYGDDLVLLSPSAQQPGLATAVPSDLSPNNQPQQDNTVIFQRFFSSQGTKH